MPTMVERLLDAADSLLRGRTPSNAARRRAVSTAYYALFHCLAKLCAEELVSGERHGSQEYAKVYRALEHKGAKEAFRRDPLFTQTSLKDIGESFVTLQSEREAADYSPPIPGLFQLGRCRELADEARRTCAAVDALSMGDRRLLAVHLLFRARKP